MSQRRLGMIGSFIDLQRDWSGVPLGIIGGLRELGVETEYVDATPARLGRPVYRWLSAVGQARNGWQLRPEMVSIGRLSGAIRRHRPRPDIAGWIHVRCLPVGRPAPGRYVTFEDITVAQIQRYDREHGFSPRRWARWNAAQADLYRHAHACCTVSTWSKASLVADYGVPEEKIHLVGLGRNVDFEAPPDRDWSTPRFLFVGRDWDRKNGEAVVRAFRRLRQDIPAARLDLVGHHPPMEGEGVVGHGHLSHADPEEQRTLLALYREATCFVMPSHAEAFAIAYLEAATAGMPVIATTNSGIGDALGADGALYVDPEDDAGLYRAMLHLCEPDIAASMGSAARRNASPFTWARVARGILGALELDGSEESSIAPVTAERPADA